MAEQQSSQIALPGGDDQASQPDQLPTTTTTINLEDGKFIDESLKGEIEQVPPRDFVGVRPFLLIAVAMVAALLVVPVKLWFDKDDQSTSAIQQLSLPEYSLEALQDPTSPQSKAYGWLLKDPKLNTYPEWRQIQRFSLATFYFALGGEEWTLDHQFLDYQVSECKWLSLGSGLASESTCDEQGRQLAMLIPDSSLAGTIPPEVSLLSSGLQFLILESKDIVGPIPTELGLLTNLKHLYLKDNSHTGGIPTEMGKLTLMENLVMPSNSGLGGPIPSQIGMLTLMKVLDMSNNALTGIIPSELGLLSILKKLSLGSNMFSSGIPLELASAGGSLTILDLPNCTLGGTIPTQFVAFKRLERLNLRDNNDLNGSVPSELGQLVHLIDLFLDGTSLTGTLPAELTSVPALERITVPNTSLTGSIPEDLCPLLWQFSCDQSQLCGCDCGECV